MTATGEQPDAESGSDHGREASPRAEREEAPTREEGDEGAAVPRTGPAPRFELGPWVEPSKVWLWSLAVLGLGSRLFWNLVVHRPGDYVFSDMRKYVDRAQDLAVNGFHFGVRELAWQAYGTHYVLSIPFRLFGPENYTAAAAFWALMGGAAVPIGYLLACRVCRRHAHAAFVGFALLAWHPSMSNTGYFLSETPFLFSQLLSTLLLVKVLQEGGRGSAMAAGLASAMAFAIRPQSAAFFVLVFAIWLLHRRRLPHVRPRHLVAIAVPLLFMLGYSLVRFEAHTGYRFGIAENANMNLTAGRCHNIVTQAFATEQQKRISERHGNTRDGRRVSLPGFRVLSHAVPDDHPFGLRPAFGSETIRFVGYIGDPLIHRDIQRACIARTGILEQIRYGVVNASLMWFYGHQWPEMEKDSKTFYPPIRFFEHLVRIGLWLPSMIGMVLALWYVRRRPAWTLVGGQLATMIGIAAIFFGTLRLRTPYDPYAIILAVELVGTVLGWAWLRARAGRAAVPGSTPAADVEPS